MHAPSPRIYYGIITARTFKPRNYGALPVSPTVLNAPSSLNNGGFTRGRVGAIEQQSIEDSTIGQKRLGTQTYDRMQTNDFYRSSQTE